MSEKIARLSVGIPREGRISERSNSWSDDEPRIWEDERNGRGKGCLAISWLAKITSGFEVY